VLDLVVFVPPRGRFGPRESFGRVVWWSPTMARYFPNNANNGDTLSQAPKVALSN
jgi:hypothetical protein